MTKIIHSAAIIKAAGNKEKSIAEYFGRVNSANTELSIAYMKSPEGWIEPGQCPTFDEYTIVLQGCLRVKLKETLHEIHAGEAIHLSANEWVQYSSPYKGGAEYIAVCLPAFSPETVHRD